MWLIVGSPRRLEMKPGMLCQLPSFWPCLTVAMM